MKTLYISDLDGTLLKNDQTLSDYSAEGIRKLTEKGIIFSFATARSAHTAKMIISKLEGNIPAVVYNGAFIVETGTGRVIESCAFSRNESRRILDSVLSHGISPRVFAIINGEERFSYTEEHLLSEGAREYFRTRKGDKRARSVSKEELYDGEIFIISCVGKRERLEPLYKELCDNCQCHFYLDNYSSDWYLELLPERATKAAGVIRLKELLGCDRIVAFGDGVNDISMFNAADECYAVENACTELKAMATGVIDSNEDDGVVRFLLSRLNGESGEKSIE